MKVMKDGQMFHQSNMFAVVLTRHSLALKCTRTLISVQKPNIIITGRQKAVGYMI